MKEFMNSLYELAVGDPGIMQIEPSLIRVVFYNATDDPIFLHDFYLN